MDVRAQIIGSAWLAIMVISVLYIGVGGINLGTNIALGALVGIAFIVTFGVAFGLQAHQAKLEEENPSTKTLVQLSIEVTEIKSMLSDVSKKVATIEKELEE
jgi:hypothetical protein